MLVVRGKIEWLDGNPPLEELNEFSRSVRDRHRGNLDYRLSVDVGNPRLLHLFENWQSRDDFEAHGVSAEVAAVGKLLEGRSRLSTLTLFEVSEKVELVA